MIHLDNQTARRLFLHQHLLLTAPTGNAGPAGLRDIIRHLGFVQMDSVNTVARAHDLILFARQQTYRPPHLRRLADRDRVLFEHWTHDASVLPVEIYPYWWLKFERQQEMLLTRWRVGRRPGFEEQLQTVLDHIRDTGACLSRDIGTDERKNSDGWWDWHPSKTALEYLWHSGDLAVCHRRGFQKAYDLAERVIPPDHRQHRPDKKTVIDWACRTALGCLGMATSGEIAAFWALVTPQEAKDWCAAQNSLIEVSFDTADGTGPRKLFALNDIEDRIAALPDPTGRMRILSPFDPALRDRKRANRLFGFDYRIEIFVPEAKRKYGYYVFPILEADRIVARVDMKCDRAKGALAVTALWPEDRVRWGKGRQTRFESELDRLRHFTGMDAITFADGWLRG